MTNPSSNEWFGMEIVDRTLEEALHLGGMQVDGDYMLDAGDSEQVR